MLLAAYVLRHVVMTATLWSLFSGLCTGQSVRQAAVWTEGGWPLSLRSAYRLTHALRRASLGFRSWLSAQAPAPATEASLPLAQLGQHLCAVLGKAPFAQLQLRMNSPLL